MKQDETKPTASPAPTGALKINTGLRAGLLRGNNTDDRKGGRYLGPTPT